jgi:hypothetical protein
MTRLSRTWTVSGLLALVAMTLMTFVGGSAGAPAPAAAASSRALVGTFKLAPGRYSRGRASGSYFRMIIPGAGRKYFKNPDSSARDKTFTLLRPGTSGGLITGRFQPHPRPPFDRIGNSRAGAIIRPTRFAGIRFGLATLPTDPQSHRKVPAPAMRVSGRRISGQAQAFTAEWNKLYFNQGAPKPGGGGPAVRGTYNPRTHVYVLQWRSLIKNGPFNGFTGFWHLQGTFRPRAAGNAAALAASRSSASSAAKKKRRCKHTHKKGTRRHTHKTCTHAKRKRRRPPAPAPAPGATGQPLTGTFKLATGTYSRTAGAAGSYFRMIFPGGSVSRGPFFDNPSSGAADRTFTLVTAGSDGGLVTGAYQEPPTPAFTSEGDALARRIILPQRFAGRNFSLSTAPKDGQTGVDVPAPTITNTAGKLSGDLQAFTASWNKLYFNQGSPKPGGGTPGRTTSVRGTYDEATRAFVLEWASAIVGGPFSGFTGYWHLQGVFEPKV